MTARLSDEQILAYLDERPDLIARYLETTADDRPSSDVRLFDATGKIAANARAEARRLSKANQSLLDAAATNMLHWQALHHATLGFLACNDLLSFAQMVDEELPVIFGLAGARLLMPAETALQEAEELGFLVLPAAQIQTILSAGSIYLGPRGPAACFLPRLPAWRRLRCQTSCQFRLLVLPWFWRGGMKPALPRNRARPY